MSNAEIRGRFVWHELMTTDPQAAGAFYSKVLRWKTQPSGMPDYTLWVAGKTQAAGLMAQPESARQSGAPPNWLVYIGTPDVDATAAAAERLGGKVLKAPADIPSVGRFAVIADPQGATFAIFTPGGSAPPEGAPSERVLLARARHAAISRRRSRSTRSSSAGAADPTHDMGPAGIYQLIEHGGAQVGGAYKLMDASKPPHWLTYISVASVDKAAAAAKAAGGRVTQGPMEVPGGSRIAQILDPQGGAFAVHEPARHAATASAPAEKPAAARQGSRETSRRLPSAQEGAARKRRAQTRRQEGGRQGEEATRGREARRQKIAGQEGRQDARQDAAGQEKSARRPAERSNVAQAPQRRNRPRRPGAAQAGGRRS